MSVFFFFNLQAARINMFPAQLERDLYGKRLGINMKSINGYRTAKLHFPLAVIGIFSALYTSTERTSARIKNNSIMEKKTIKDDVFFFYHKMDE